MSANGRGQGFNALGPFLVRWRAERQFRWLVIGILLWFLLALVLLHQLAGPRARHTDRTEKPAPADSSQVGTPEH